ncbi:MAG: DUF4190 domain-containing protein [Thermanaerothrix sp.]|nr:DUF4190 domain-containing protein [Thermanaerothrix sp.]
MTNEPAVSPPPPSTANRPGLAIASLVLGFITLIAWCLPICGAPLAIAGIITGILGLNSTNRSMAIAGLIIASLGLILSIVNSIVGMLFAPQFSQMFEEILRELPVQP